MDEDTRSFDGVMAAFALPKNTDEEKKARTAAIQAATLYATQVPLQVMKTAYQVLPLAELMVAEGNPNSVTDAAVGALCARTAIQGALLNVKINASGLKDRTIAEAILQEAASLMQGALEAEARIIAQAETKM